MLAEGASFIAAVTTGDLVGVLIAGERATDAAESVTVVGLATGLTVDGEVVIAGRAGTVRFDFPLEPTVVHAPPDGAVTGACRNINIPEAADE